MAKIQCQIEFDAGKKYVKIMGKVNDEVREKTLTFKACSPADRRTSFSGSGLPFPSANFGFENSPNVGSLKLDQNNVFVLEMMTPNSYYMGLGTLLIPPTIYFTYNNRNGTQTDAVKLCDSIPYRSLTYPGSRTSPDFYSSYSTLPVRGQEEIIKTNQYPSDTMKEYSQFWGSRPPV
jgi:hypothetical protein